MKPALINAGIYLYRDHYLIKNERGDARAWDCFPVDVEGIRLSKAKSQADAIRQVDSFHKNRKKVVGLF